MTTPGTVTVRDAATGATTTIPSPAERCEFAAVGAGALLWNCKRNDAFDSGLVGDLRSGALTPLPAAVPRSPDTDGGSYIAVGARWARVRFSGYHFAYSGYVERATGRRVYPDNNDRRVAVDLDSPTLTRRLCSPVRRPLVPNQAFPISVLPGALAIHLPFAAGVTYADTEAPPGRLLLQRCGRRATLLRTCRRFTCSQPVINGRVVAWSETFRDRHAPLHSRIQVRSLPTGRTSVTIGGQATLALVGARLFVAVDRRLLRVAL